jgi:translation initiation factor IF-2
MADEDITIQVGEQIVVADLAKKLDASSAEVVGKLMENGVMATLNDVIDHDTAAIIAAEFEATVEKSDSGDSSRISLKSERKLSDKAESRPPVVAVMGHVDHGKTTLLDAIRDADVAAGEAGGITQHISAYQITYSDRKITFLDTPGHEAFAALRQHGAALTDVAVIVVAANDGVMPQTEEAIAYAKRASVPMVVAINKIDDKGADVDRAKQQLSEAGLTPEDWGGDVTMVEVSALKKQNIEELLDLVLLTADIDEHKADRDVPAEGIVIEANTETGRGSVVTALIEHGELRVGDIVVAGSAYGKVKALTNDRGESIEMAGPSMPVTIVGFKDVPIFGQRFVEMDDEKAARKQAQEVKDQHQKETTAVVKSATGGDLLAHIDATKQQKLLNIVVRADVQGSLESIIQSLQTLGNDEVAVKVVSRGIGNISESDVTAAEASQGLIYGFNVNATSSIKRLAARQNVPLEVYDVIYELLEQTTDLLEDMIEPEIIESEQGKLKVKGVFRTTASKVICGGEVTKGKINIGSRAIIGRDGDEVGRGEISKLQRGKDDAKEVFKGDMCGLEINTDQKINVKKGDNVTVIKQETVKKGL